MLFRPGAFYFQRNQNPQVVPPNSTAFFPIGRRAQRAADSNAATIPKGQFSARFLGRQFGPATEAAQRARTSIGATAQTPNRNQTAEDAKTASTTVDMGCRYACSPLH
jgi:hypothetical protein